MTNQVNQVATQVVTLNHAELEQFIISKENSNFQKSPNSNSAKLFNSWQSVSCLRKDWKLTNLNGQENFSNGYYTIAECARKLATSPQTIYNWISKGEFAPVVRVASTFRVKAEDFENWMKSVVVKVSSEKEEK